MNRRVSVLRSLTVAFFKSSCRASMYRSIASAKGTAFRVATLYQRTAASRPRFLSTSSASSLRKAIAASGGV